MKRLVLSVAALTLMAGSALADPTYVEGGVKINDKVTTNVSASHNTNYAVDNARAFQSIGTIHGGTEVEAEVDLSVVADYNTNYAEDEGLACQAIGSIGEFPACREANQQ